MLNTDITIDGTKAKVVLDGKLNVTTSAELKEKLSAIPEAVKEIELDIEKLAYTSSAGLRVILQEHNQLKQRGGTLTICHTNQMIMEVFEDTGLADCLNIQKA